MPAGRAGESEQCPGERNINCKAARKQAHEQKEGKLSTKGDIQKNVNLQEWRVQCRQSKKD